MTLRCAFYGHIHRKDICEGEATSFLRTPRGILWPFCTPCADRHKKLVTEMVGTKAIDHRHVVATEFDVGITDELVEQFRKQDPDEIKRVLDRADAMHAELDDK